MKATFTQWAASVPSWLLTHGLRIVLVVVGAWLLNRIAGKFIEKAVRLAVRPDDFSSPDAERKREDTLIHIFSVTQRVVHQAADR